MIATEIESEPALLPPAAEKCKSLPEETAGWPAHRYFFRSFAGGMPQCERYLNLKPKRIQLVTFFIGPLGTPTCLFECVE